MKILECDICKCKVNAYGNAFDKEGNRIRNRSMYRLDLEIDSANDDCDFENFMICHNCFSKLYFNNLTFHPKEKEKISKDDAIKIVHDTIHDFFDDSETFNDKDKMLLKINKAICNNIDGY